ANRYAAGGTRSALIVTGEESTAQVRLRAERTGALDERLFLAAENDLGAVLSHVQDVQPGLLVVDSVQTIATAAVEGTAGTVAQIRSVAATLIALAKASGIATILVGHVTKDGSIAGPRVLEHLVDVVLYFEGDRHSALRLVRATKNRFGTVDEIGCFEMRETGLAGLPDPSELFLSDRPVAVSGTCVTVIVEGRRPLLTEIQALTAGVNYGTPRRSLSGLDGQRVAMLLAALGQHAGVPLANYEVYASTVGGISATEPAADLAIALAVASAARNVDVPNGLCAIGEISLAGEVRRVAGIERRLVEAARLGFHTAIVPAGHRGETVGPDVEGIRTLPVTTLADALTVLTGPRGTGLDEAPRRRTLRAVHDTT
ncbi:MAG: DNA repair protein RadA, partial [Actinobacteria bacterium]|nr:DNA repair protein RadA [Actinomycetota bacterium]